MERFYALFLTDRAYCIDETAFQALEGARHSNEAISITVRCADGCGNHLVEVAHRDICSIIANQPSAESIAWLESPLPQKVVPIFAASRA